MHIFFSVNEKRIFAISIFFLSLNPLLDAAPWDPRDILVPSPFDANMSSVTFFDRCFRLRANFGPGHVKHVKNTAQEPELEAKNDGTKASLSYSVQ